MYYLLFIASAHRGQRNLIRSQIVSQNFSIPHFAENSWRQTTRRNPLSPRKLMISRLQTRPFEGRQVCNSPTPLTPDQLILTMLVPFLDTKLTFKRLCCSMHRDKSFLGVRRIIGEISRDAKRGYRSLCVSYRFINFDIHATTSLFKLFTSLIIMA